VARKKRRSKKNNKKIRYTRQRERLKFHKAKLLSVSKLLLDKPKRRDYAHKQTPTKRRKILHDLRHITKKPHLNKRPYRYGTRDKIITLHLHSKKKDGKPYKTQPRQGFADARRVEVCKRRSIRREVLFKIGKAGKGKRIHSPKNYTELSKLRC
jgi:hypothetical protein